MSLPLAFWEMEKLKLKQKSVLKLLLLALSLAAIFLSGSRSAWLAVLVVGLSWLVVKRKFKVLAGLLIGSLIPVIFFFKTQPLGALLPLINRGSIWENRLIIWQEGIKAVVKRPILGYGQENFALVFLAERHLPVDNAHNLFLEILVSSGVLGLGAYLMILQGAFRKAPFPAKLSLLAFLIRAQFNPLSIPEIALFWYLLGLS